MTRLERLLRPKSIAVIGGGFFAPNVVMQSMKMGFAGEIWPVHPTKDEIAGVRAYRSIADIPAAPDATFIGVNRKLTVDIVRELADRGAGGAVCFAAGFRETGDHDAQGDALQQALVAAAGEMPIIGPNCYGLINYADGALLWPDQHGGRRLEPGERGVAIVTQSGNIACNVTMQRRGLPLAFVVTTGNQAQTGVSGVALGLIEDPRVSALGLHIEGFDDIAGYERLAARARELGKPVAVLKMGRSEQARASTLSHTASLAGASAVSEAFLARLGFASVDSIPSLIEALKLMHAVGPLGGGRIGCLSSSGGEASLLADAAEGRSMSFPPLGDAHRAAVKATLGSLVAVANPLDYHTFIWNNEPAMTETFTAFVGGGFDFNLIVMDFPRTDRCSDAEWWPTVRAFEAALRTHGASGGIVTTIPENLPEEHSEAIMKLGIVPLHGVAEALDAIGAAAFVGRAWGRQVADGLRSVTPPSVLPDISPTRGEISQSPAASPRSPEDAQAQKLPISPRVGEMPGRAEGGALGTTLTEAAAKAELARAGLPVPRGLEAATTDEAVGAAEQLGFPVALKALGVAHKSEAGAVALGLKDEAAVREAAHRLIGLGSGLYVERMVQGGVAELIVGITRDPLFGPVMTVGSGGVLVELLKDSATLLLPAGRRDIEDALRGLKLFPLLDGFRGRPKADLTAAISAIEGIAGFALANADRLEELDVNPLIVCAAGQGAWVADALMVVSAAPSSPLRGGSIGEADRGGVAKDGLDLLAVPPEPTPSGRFAATSPARGEGNSNGDLP